MLQSTRSKLTMGILNRLRSKGVPNPQPSLMPFDDETAVESEDGEVDPMGRTVRSPLGIPPMEETGEELDSADETESQSAARRRKKGKLNPRDRKLALIGEEEIE